MDFFSDKSFPTLPFKSAAVAVLLTVVLGPVGLLYGTVWGGALMILLGFVVVSARLIVPIILLWLICCVWVVASTNRYNKKLLSLVLKKNNA